MSGLLQRLLTRARGTAPIDPIGDRRIEPLLLPRYARGLPPMGSPSPDASTAAQEIEPFVQPRSPHPSASERAAAADTNRPAPPAQLTSAPFEASPRRSAELDGKSPPSAAIEHATPGVWARPQRADDGSTRAPGHTPVRSAEAGTAAPGSDAPLPLSPAAAQVSPGRSAVAGITDRACAPPASILPRTALTTEVSLAAPSAPPQVSISIGHIELRAPAPAAAARRREYRPRMSLGDFLGRGPRGGS
jgi:hypothetical protein